VSKSKSLYHFEDHTITSSDEDSSIFIRHYCRGKPKLHFLIVHGALEHSGRHHDLVVFWLKTYKQDVAVTVYDHIGHGRSGGARAYVPGFDVYVRDLQQVGEFIQSKNNSDTKTIICAHSLGGLVTLTCLLNTNYGWKFPLAGVIFSSPCIRPKLILGSASETLLEKLDVFLSKLHMPMIFKGSDLTRDSHRANDFDTDSLIPKYMTVRMAKEVIAAGNKVRGLSYYLHIPSLFLIAGRDQIVDAESTTLFAHGIDKNLTEVIQYPEHHHELWNELDRFDIFEQMRVWVGQLLKENP
jgi:lysophospholipase